MSTPPRLPLNTFAIGFGLAGLAELWTTAGAALAMPEGVADALWGVAAVAWLWLVLAHVVRGRRSGTPLGTQLRHPAQGPIAALVPATAMLLAGEVMRFARPAGVVLFTVAFAVAVLFASWLVAGWLRGGLELDAVHGGYLLPTVAVGFLGADIAAEAGLTSLGWAGFGIGAFFWVLMTTLLVLRLASRPGLPDPLVPTIAILVAPPALAGLAWFALHGPTIDGVAAAIGGLGVLLLLVQLSMIGRYRLLRFSLGFWSFTFPAAGVASDATTWARIAAFPGWQAVVVVLLALVTVLVGAIGVRSALGVLPRGGRARAEATLAAANAADAAGSRGAGS